MKLTYKRYSLAKGVQKIKTRTAIMLSVIGLAMGGGTGLSLLALSSAHAVSGYSLFGSATTQSDGAHTVSANATDFGGISLTLPAGTTVGSLTNLSASFNVDTGTCYGGSPRFSVVTPAGNIFVYMGDAPSFATCAGGNTGDLLSALDGRVDTSQVAGGTYGDTWSHAQTIAGAQPITEMDIVVDGGWHAPQEFTFTSATANTTSYNFVPTPTLDWGSKVNPSQCANRVGAPVVNVTEKITNDIDSGTQGNYWAQDNNNKQIQVWRTGSKTSNTYCAVVRFEGQFQTVHGASPGGTTMLSGNTTGTFEGGYTAILTSTTFSQPKKGHVGTLDFNCTTGNPAACIPPSWVQEYFGDQGSSSFNYQWWGWIYTGNNGSVWVNSIGGNAGDITG